jgi:HEAT repeat protein
MVCDTKEGMLMAMFTRLLTSTVLALASAAPQAARGLPVAGLVYQPRDEPVWFFDPISALIGFVLGLLVGLGLYLLRHRIAAARDTIRDRLLHVRQRVSTGIEERYREQVIEAAEYSHLLKRYAALSDVYVRRRFVVAQALPRDLRPPESEAEGQRWHEMRLHDILHSSPVTIDLAEAVGQYNRLAFLGPLGSGRTTLLSYLTQLYARKDAWRLTFPEPEEEDEQDLIAARNRERDRLPVQIALQGLDFSLAEQGGRHVLIDPITDYLTTSLRGLIAAPSATMVRTRIMAGNCILLFDNLDMLHGESRQQALSWLDQLARAYPENIYVVVGGTEGYASLWDVDFATLMLGEFEPRQVYRFAERWERLRQDLDVRFWEEQLADTRAAFEAEVAQAKREGRPPPTEQDFRQPEMPEATTRLLDAWPAGRREGIMPIDLALAAMLWREQNAVPAEPLMRYAQYVLMAFNHAADSLLRPPQWALVISSAAWAMQLEEQHEIGRDIFEQAVADLLDRAYVASANLRQFDEEEEEEKPDFGRQGRAAFEIVVGTGDLFVDMGRGRVAFVHPTLRGYFAAQHAARGNERDVLVAHIRNEQWQDTILFYSALSDAAPLAQARMVGQDDLFYSNFFGAAGYLCVSPEVDEKVKKGLLAQSAQMFLNPKQPTVLSRGAAAAIASSKDEGALYLFGQAMRSEDPHVRRMGVWGLGRMDDPRVLAGLQHALKDPDRLVRAEAMYALGAVGGDPAIDGLVQGLQDQDELVRRIAAEVLAIVGGEGHDLLREGVNTDDMYIRRASTFGLGRIDEPWAIQIVDELRREDEEWFVRSAATEVIDRVTGDPPPIQPAPPKLEDQEWLVTWASGRGMTLGSWEDAFRVLLQAVQDGDWTIKLAAADVLRVCAGQEAIPVLKRAVTDEDVLVREAAYAALYEISQRTGFHIVT